MRFLARLAAAFLHPLPLLLPIPAALEPSQIRSLNLKSAFFSLSFFWFQAGISSSFFKKKILLSCNYFQISIDRNLKKQTLSKRSSRGNLSHFYSQPRKITLMRLCCSIVLRAGRQAQLPWKFNACQAYLCGDGMSFMQMQAPLLLDSEETDRRGGDTGARTPSTSDMSRSLMK